MAEPPSSTPLEDAVKRELAELTADLRVYLEWERTGGVSAFPESAEAERALSPLVVARPEAVAAPRPGPTVVSRAPEAPSSGLRPPLARPAPREEEIVARPSSPPPAPTGAAADAGTLEELRVVLGDCRRCKLAEGRHSIVFGQGNPHAELVLVGEGPGYHEDRQGLAFVGVAGELLTKILAAIGLTRDDVYIANVVKCRPPQNRDPQEDEVAACRPFVERQVALVHPKVIVALGRVATQALLGTTASIGSLRGRFTDYHGVPLMPTYHPAALLRDPNLKRDVWQDMKSVREKLQEGR